MMAAWTGWRSIGWMAAGLFLGALGQVRAGAQSGAAVTDAGATGSTPAMLTVGQTGVLYGPYNGSFLADGVGLVKPLHAQEAVASAQAGWSMSLWMKTAEAGQTALLAGVGRPGETTPRYLALRDGRVAFWAGGSGLGAGYGDVPSSGTGSGAAGAGAGASSGAALAAGVWHLLAVSVGGDGVTHLYADGAEVASGAVALGAAADVLEMAPGAGGAWPRHFGGWLAQVSLRSGALGADEVRAMSAAIAGLDNLPFEEGSKAWPVQTRGQRGMTAPQDPALLPHSRAAAQAAKAVAPLAGTDETTEDGARLVLRHGWQMAEASGVGADGAMVSSEGFRLVGSAAGQMAAGQIGPTGTGPSETGPGGTGPSGAGQIGAGQTEAGQTGAAGQGWMAATVPGTVLTTLIDRGVYPNPDFGLNNMVIPESLSKQSFWYREEFTLPGAMRGRRLTLRFQGINYHAAVWMNGRRVGEITGAFLHRGFDVSGLVREGRNVVAVKIDPPPHGGIAHEQSLAAGAGDNGGMMMLDGPTFGATEGWDWIPGIRDRNMGLWQDVVLEAAGAVGVDVPQIVTKLPLPDLSRAEVTVRVPLTNDGPRAVRGTVEISFDDVKVTKAVTVPPGGMTVELTPREYVQLSVAHPRLWWPNGYGEAALHTMRLTFRAGGKVSDVRVERFGIREITYELGAFDGTGHARRVEVDPTVAALAGRGAAVLQTHEGFRETPEGWVPTLAPLWEMSGAVKAAPDARMGMALAIRVNGVRIACKGGSWGMDDMLKRVSRARLEPFFRLHREANVNMIRNWMGQNTEDVFYELADEYGLLVWNDFWDSTQDWNLEPDDAGLFLENAKETIRRYRNHPSIAVWCGRNEGVPPPAINEGLARLITELDGTRYYSADSNKINLHDSGPYKYQEPETYFTTLARGFAVETGLASPPTMETWQAWLAKEDQWPISDAWAYHDWHQGGNGDTAPFMQTMIEEFGAPVSLADFDRKAQMLNYESHRAVFEGFNAHLWAPNSGRMLWMTQPAWPSSVWQIFSHDYDTQGSFYAVKKACEPVHVQMNLPGHEVVVVNNTEAALAGVQVTAAVYDLAGRKLSEQTSPAMEARAQGTTRAQGLELQGAMEEAGVVLVKVQLKDRAGAVLSDNFYWEAARKGEYRKMGEMAGATVSGSATVSGTGERRVAVTLVNRGTGPALAAKLTLLEGGERVLPAYYSDNYISLLAGETKVVSIAYPAGSGRGALAVGLRGWNIAPATIAVTP